jgi:hypothetical protein
MPCTEIGHIKVIIPGLAINLAEWLWPILDADERDYAILKQILISLSILGAVTMGQVNFPDGLEKVISTIRAGVAFLVHTSVTRLIYRI